MVLLGLLTLIILLYIFEAKLEILLIKYVLLGLHDVRLYFLQFRVILNELIFLNGILRFKQLLRFFFFNFFYLR